MTFPKGLTDWLITVDGGSVTENVTVMADVKQVDMGVTP